VSLRNQLVCLFGSQCLLASLVDTLGFGNCDAFSLSFANQLLLKLRERPKHREHETSGCVRIAGERKPALYNLDRYAARVAFPDDSVEVLDITGKPIKAVNEQSVPIPDVFECRRQLRALKTYP